MIKHAPLLVYFIVSLHQCLVKINGVLPARLRNRNILKNIKKRLTGFLRSKDHLSRLIKKKLDRGGYEIAGDHNCPPCIENFKFPLKRVHEGLESVEKTRGMIRAHKGK